VIPDELAAHLSAARQGQQAACAWLCAQYSPRVLRVALGLLGDLADAEEVTQDAFVYAFRNLARYDANRAGFATWLCTIAISRCRNKRRRKWLAAVPLHFLREPIRDNADSLRPVEAALEARGIRRGVWQAVRALPPKLGEAVALRYFGGLSYAELGQVLALSPKTAESRVRLGLQALRGRLADTELEFEPA
jgi:RNA polymerase sigma-70 factor (ECF subfamily)